LFITDICIPGSFKGFREGGDEVLERALECVRGERRKERGERRNNP
jgi:hypothetical protein